MRTVKKAMWIPGRLSRDWLMPASFVLVGAIFVICQIICERRPDADRTGGHRG